MRREDGSLQAGTAWVFSLKNTPTVLPEKFKPAISVRGVPLPPRPTETSQALLSKISAVREIAPAAQIIVEKSHDRLAINSNRLVYHAAAGDPVAKGNTELGSRGH